MTRTVLSIVTLILLTLTLTTAQAQVVEPVLFTCDAAFGTRYGQCSVVDTNDRGETLIASTDAQEGVLLSAALQRTAIRCPGTNTTGTLVQGLSATGAVVGTCIRNSSAFEGFWRGPLGSYYILRVPFANAKFTEPYGVNEKFQVVGTWVDTANKGRGFVANGVGGASTTYTNLEAPFPGTRHTFAVGINAAGHIVGHFVDGQSHSHGFVLKNGVYTQLDVPGASDTQPFDLNDQGEIVGAYLPNGGTRTQSFLLTGQTYQALAVAIPGTIETVIVSRTNSGKMAGQYSLASDNPQGRTIHGFIGTNIPPTPLVAPITAARMSSATSAEAPLDRLPLCPNGEHADQVPAKLLQSAIPCLLDQR